MCYFILFFVEKNSIIVGILLERIRCIMEKKKTGLFLEDFLKMSSQMDGKTDERSKLLLERLKMLEAENSSLVLENEQQRQQYEKCLDEIANQVVQALLAQKVRRAGNTT